MNPWLMSMWFQMASIPWAIAAATALEQWVKYNVDQQRNQQRW